jgi:hypothetical protein
MARDGRLMSAFWPVSPLRPAEDDNRDRYCDRRLRDRRRPQGADGHHRHDRRHGLGTICDQINQYIETKTRRVLAPISSATYLFDGDGSKCLRYPRASGP